MRDDQERLYRLPAPRGARAAVGWWVAFLLLLGAADAGSLASGFMARRLGYSARLGAAWLVRPRYPDRWLLAACLAVGAAAAASLLGAGGGAGAGDGSAGGRRRALAPALVPVGVALFAAACGPLYGPLRILGWMHAIARASHPAAPAAPAVPAAVPALAGLLRQAAAVGAAGLVVCWVSTAAFGLLSLRRLRRVGDLHGSSHWASPREAAAAGLLGRGPGGIVVGRLGRRPLVDHRDRHVLVYAPSGTGKSSCLVIPTMLRWQGSILAFDVKGELWARSAGHRHRQGHTAIRFDPTLAAGSAAYNPLLVIPRSAEDVAGAQDVADILVNPEGRESSGGERFFEDSARALLTGVILHVLYTERHPSLASCLRLLSSPEPAKTWQAMQAAEHDPDHRQGWQDPDGRPGATHPTVVGAAGRLLGMDHRTATGVVATAQSKLALFEDPLVAANTTRCDFRGEDLIAGARPVSVYLTVAPSDLDRMRPLLRIVLNQITRQLTREARPGRRPVLLMLDEFTALGRLDFMHRGIGFFRGYGIRVFLSIQSLEQLFQIYGQHQSIGANCGVQIAYGANDLATAKLLSEMTGRRTVEFRRLSQNRGLTGGRRSESEAEAGRPLLSPDEVRRLPEGEALVYVAGCAPIRGRRVPYFRDRRLARWAETAPPERAVAGGGGEG